MEFVPLVGPALQVLKVLQETADKDREIRSELKIGIRKLLSDLKLIKKGIEKYEEQELQELAYEIEDFLPDILIRSRLSFILTAMRLNRGSDQMSVITYLQGKMDDIINKLGSTSSGAPRMGKSGGLSDAQLVGDAKSEIEELLSEADGELRMVSIVGCSGLGKTALAKALYSDAKADKKFDLQAFVVASECSEDEAEDHVMKKAEYLLRKILKKDGDTSAAAPSEDTSNLAQLTTELHTELKNKRYLVVVDDVKEVGLCKFLKEVFPNDKKSSSRVIVTTSIQSVATFLSCGRYRYTMQRLNNEDSKKLLSREMFCSEANESIVNSAEILVGKCKGSPLALIGAGKHLMPNATTAECQRVGKALATEVSDATQGSALWELKRSLVECYGSLPKYHDRRCLLSVIMSPRDHQINKNSLLRRWIAEGLVYAHQELSGMDVATKSFDQFVDHSIVGPGLTGRNSKVKGYQVQGIMLEFIIHKSTCVTNFATIIDPLIHPCGRLPLEKDADNRIRRLFLFVSEGAERCIKEIENHLDFIRWLTICHSPTSTSIPFDLSKCQLLRVLDLEGCKGVNETVLANICKLIKYLAYLSLRGSDARQIPKEITALVNLETLDIRETEVKNLPMEVLLMPRLAHLFGKFQLVGSYKVLLSKKEKESQPTELVMRLRQVTGKKHKKEKYFRWESNLETLSGVIVDNEEENLKEIMLHAKKLKKVKIWCKMMKTVLPVEKFTGREVLDSLSVDSSNQPIEMLTDRFLESLSGAWAIHSLKLRGPLQGLPATPGSFMKLKLLGKLRLSSTGLKWETLSVLQNISCLLKLKLAEDRREIGDESFIVEKGGFPSLKQLCIEAPELPKVQLKKGATPFLVSLELLLCPGAPLRNHATAEPETLLQNGLMPDVTTAQPVDPLQMEETSNIITHQPEVPTQTAIAKIELRLRVEGLLHLACLSEVIIQHSADLEKMRNWEKIAKMHRNKPYIKIQEEQPWSGSNTTATIC